MVETLGCTLTHREEQIALRLCSIGCAAISEIAQHPGVSDQTIKNQLTLSVQEGWRQRPAWSWWCGCSRVVASVIDLRIWLLRQLEMDV